MRDPGTMPCSNINFSTDTVLVDSYCLEELTIVFTKSSNSTLASFVALKLIAGRGQPSWFTTRLDLFSVIRPALVPKKLCECLVYNMYIKVKGVPNPQESLITSLFSEKPPAQFIAPAFSRRFTISVLPPSLAA